MICLAHILNLIGDSFHHPFEEVNNCVRRFNKTFNLAGGRKARCLAHLKSYVLGLPEPESGKKPTVTMAPNPIATRWGGWYDCVCYHIVFVDAYPAFIKEEMRVSSQPRASVKELSTIMANEKLRHRLQLQMDFISDNCKPLVQLNDRFQSRRPCTLLAYDILQPLSRDCQANEFLTVADCSWPVWQCPTGRG